MGDELQVPYMVYTLSNKGGELHPNMFMGVHNTSVAARERGEELLRGKLSSRTVGFVIYKAYRAFVASVTPCMEIDIK